jgi:acetyl esterase
MIDPELDAFLEVWNEKWAGMPAGAEPKHRRLMFEYIAEQMRLPTPQNVTSSARFVTSGGRFVLVRIDRAQDGSERQPCLIYMHGGAWMQGSPMTHADITMRIAAQNRQTVISVDYALAPEHPFPTAINEVMDVARIVKENAADFGVDAHLIAIGGDSAGANLAAAACIGLRGTDHAPMAQLLVYPAVDFEMSRPAYTENADAPLLNIRGMPAVNAMYCPNPEDRRNPLAAPYLAQSHEGLPPAFVAVAENDPLRDDGKDYVAKLRAAGVAVEFDEGKGLIHGYLRAMAYCSASRDNLQKMCDWLASQYKRKGSR